MNKEITATFIGHNETFGINAEQLRSEIIGLIENGTTNFISGGMGGFDRMCAKLLYDLKADYPQINSFLVIPYLSFKVFEPKYFTSTIFPESLECTPYRAAVVKRNRYLVDNAAYAVCFVNHISGGASKTYDYAQTKDIRIINILSVK